MAKRGSIPTLSELNPSQTWHKDSGDWLDAIGNKTPSPSAWRGDRTKKITGQEIVSWPVCVAYGSLTAHQAGEAVDGVESWSAGPVSCGAKEWILPARGLGAGGGEFLTGGAGGTAGRAGGAVP
jgi:hypothetical protein